MPCQKTKVRNRLVTESFDWNEESLSSEDEGATRFKAFMAITEDEPAEGKANAICGERGKRKETISSKEVVFTKKDVSLSEIIYEITSNSKSECENQEPLPPLTKLLGSEPIESLVKVIMKKTQTKSPSVPDPSLVKKANSSTEQLLLTLIEVVKGLKE
nr:hypothetical protein [Tanacetum cinerariifolium]